MTRPTDEDVRAEANKWYDPNTFTNLNDAYRYGAQWMRNLGMHWEDVTPENPVPMKDIENGYYDFLFIIKGSGRKLCSWDMTDEDLDWYLDMVTHFMRIKLPVQVSGKREVG